MTSWKHPPLFRYIQRLQGERPWGRLLDAGTGEKSICWIADLPTERWTAVSASPRHAQRVREAIKDKQRAEDKIVLGHWGDAKLLEGEVYDTVIADYLLGAIEGFSPYFQPFLFRRLRPLTRGVLYVKGLEPYVPIPLPDSEAGRLLWDIGRHRDACVMLGGDMPYREYPAPWVSAHLQGAGFTVRSLKHFPAVYKARFVNAQMDIASAGLSKLSDTKLAAALTTRGEELRAKALEHIKTEGSIRYGRNYVIAAKPV